MPTFLWGIIPPFLVSCFRTQSTGIILQACLMKIQEHIVDNLGLNFWKACYPFLLCLWHMAGDYSAIPKFLEFYREGTNEMSDTQNHWPLKRERHIALKMPTSLWGDHPPLYGIMFQHPKPRNHTTSLTLKRMLVGLTMTKG